MRCCAERLRWFARVRDLRSAMASAIGIEIAPGGDTGPASSVPDFWGLKEFDAFLLVMDGVPWGGAFNPALTTLAALLYTIWDFARAAQQEEDLLSRTLPGYAEYAGRTPRFLPHLSRER